MVAFAGGRRALSPFAGKGLIGARSPHRAKRTVRKFVVVGDRRFEVGIFAIDGSGSFSSPVASARPALPSQCLDADRRQRPAGALAAMRRVHATPHARVSSWVACGCPFAASCSTRSSMWTSWPSIQSAAAASAKWVRRDPAPADWLVNRLSSRASAFRFASGQGEFRPRERAPAGSREAIRRGVEGKCVAQDRHCEIPRVRAEMSYKSTLV